MRAEKGIKKRRHEDWADASYSCVGVCAVSGIWLDRGVRRNRGNDRIFIAIAIIVFIVAGGAILILSAKKLIRKEYVDAEEQTEDDKKQ